MSNALHLVKVIGAWFFCVAAIVLLFIGHEVVAAGPVACAAISIACSQLPE